jgi:hypothetical protein
MPEGIYGMASTMYRETRPQPSAIHPFAAG